MIIHKASPCAEKGYLSLAIEVEIGGERSPGFIDVGPSLIEGQGVAREFLRDSHSLHVSFYGSIFTFALWGNDFGASQQQQGTFLVGQLIHRDGIGKWSRRCRVSSQEHMAVAIKGNELVQQREVVQVIEHQEPAVVAL